MPSSSPLLPLLLVLLYLPPSLASITMCGQDYDSVGCGRINNVQFGFIVAIPLIIPALIFYAVRYKDFSLPGHPSSISVSMSLSDRNVNFRRRSQPSALPQPGAVELESLYTPSSTAADFTLTLHHNGTRRVLHCDSLPPHDGTLISLSLTSLAPRLAVFRSNASNHWELVVNNRPSGLFLSCFGGAPSEGALLCLREESEACNFSFGVARGETLGPVTLSGGYNVKCDGGSGNDKLFAQVGEGEADVFKFKRDEVA